MNKQFYAEISTVYIIGGDNAKPQTATSILNANMRGKHQEHLKIDYQKTDTILEWNIISEPSEKHFPLPGHNVSQFKGLYNTSETHIF